MKGGAKAKVDEGEEVGRNIRAIAEIKVEVEVEDEDSTNSSPIAIKEQTKQVMSDLNRQIDLKRLGSSEAHNNMDMDLPTVHNPPLLHDGIDHPTATSSTSKLDRSVLGIATAATVGLYLYKKRHPVPVPTKTKNVKVKHSVPDQMEMEIV